MRKAIGFFFLVFIFFLQQFAFADSPEKKIYTARNINPHPPVIDGNLNDPIWEKVSWGGGFIQRKPYEGKEPSQATAFKILYDDKNVYVAIRAYDDEPDKIEKRMSRRDDIEGDWVEVHFDSYYDHRTAFGFVVNAAGVKCDFVISNDGNNHDDTWDPIWYVKSAYDEQGWTAEMKVPLSQLRFGKKENQIWGLQVERRLFRKQETSQWQLIPQKASGWTSHFGELHGIKGIKAQRQVELTPYTVGKTQRFEREEGNPFATGSSSNFYGGLDGKVGLTSDLTLDFTINPDFGQVEADPSVVNLTAFETYYEEKRPFFIEGRNILSFQIMGGDGSFSRDTLFYSRRIGRIPQYYPETEDDEYLDMPANTTILGAFKITGKTRNGISIGIIDSLTAKENAQISYLGQSSDVTVEPLTNYFGLRLQKDYGKGNTILGGMFTATNRNIKNEELNFLHDAAYTGGLDFIHYWKDKTYYFSLNTVFSHVRGSKEAILETQESPVRYYQRPDTDHVSVDPSRTSLSGYGGTMNFGKGGSAGLRFNAGVTWRSPGLELNDMGYLRRADAIMQWVWGNYRIAKPFSIFREVSLNFNEWMGWDFGGEQIFKGGNFGMWGQFKNYWSLSMGMNRQGEGLYTSALRGGPALRWPGGWNSWIFINSDSRKKLHYFMGTFNYYADQNDSRVNGVEIGATYRPNKALSLSISPFYEFNLEELQYVTTEEFGSANKYIFARIDQKTLGITCRLDLSLTPDLSIQFYGQPFISAGQYSDFKDITDSRAKAYGDRFRLFTDDEMSYDPDAEEFYVDANFDGIADYSFETPDFNFLQFRSNLVLRWEYIPGSTMYLVWSQGRTDFSSVGDFSFRNGMRDLFNVYPQNIFLIKFSYCFNL
ncbi:MAG: hypothetical protein GTO17_02435 [Candidatus Aminicenantes bacterium]|nr:hypothetical protein [Candidatus Aminicenantes bacterium]